MTSAATPASQRESAGGKPRRRAGSGGGAGSIACIIRGLPDGRVPALPHPGNSETWPPGSSFHYLRDRALVVSDQISRRALVIGRRAARMAGRAPPMTPATRAMISARTAIAGEIWKLNATSENVWKFVVPVEMLLIG